MAKWTVDNSHSHVGFSVKHMMVAKVKGEFNDYSGTITGENIEDLTTAQIDFTINVASINTKSEDRDNHLRSGDFFDTENYPEMKFTSTKIEKDGDDYEITGDFTIKDLTKQVTFEAEYNGHGVNPWGVDVYGFEAKTKINREEFGLTWNAALETGGVLVGKDVKIELELEVNPAQEEN